MALLCSARAIAQGSQAQAYHTGLAEEWGEGMPSNPTRTVSARVQGSQGCPWLSGWAQKLLQPQDVTLTPSLGL